MPVTAVTLSRTRENVVIGALSLAAFAVAVNVNLVGAMMPFLREDPLYAPLGAAATERVSQLLWVTNAAATVAALLVGPFVDRFGRLVPTLIGGALFLLAMVTHVYADSHALLTFARVLSGLGGGFVYTAASTAVADLVPYERRGAAMGLFSLGLFLAIPVGLPAALWIAGSGAAGWRFAFGWLALPSVLAIAAFASLVPPGLRRGHRRVRHFEVLRQPHVVPALLSVMLYTGAFFTAVQFVPSWLDGSGVLPKSEHEAMWIVVGIGTAAGSLLLPRLADQLGKRVMVLATSAGVGLGMLALAHVGGLVGLCVVGIPLTLLAAARSPSLAALMSEIVDPRMRGTLMGMQAVAVNLGNFVFTSSGSKIYAELGYPALLYCGAGAIFLAFALVLAFVKVDL
jgi:predicted MFS family arabinose efflux permease